MHSSIWLNLDNFTTSCGWLKLWPKTWVIRIGWDESPAFWPTITAVQVIIPVPSHLVNVPSPWPWHMEILRDRFPRKIYSAWPIGPWATMNKREMYQSDLSSLSKAIWSMSALAEAASFLSWL